MPLFVEDATGFALEDGTDLYLENEFDIVDSDTLTIADAGEQIGVTATDTLTVADAGETLAVALTDDDFASFTDAGETVAAALTDDEPLSIVDDGIATVPVTDSDSFTITDAGEALAVTTADADTATLADAGESLAVALTDTEALTIAESEAVGIGTTVTPVSDADTLTISETASIVVAISDSDTLSIVDDQQTPFTPTASVFFGDNPASYTTDSPTQITALSPPGDAAGVVDVIVSTDVGVSPNTPLDDYTYIDTTNPVPTVTDVSPGVGPAAGGTTVVVTGTNFLGVLSVQFGSFPCDMSLLSVDSPTQITCVSPPGSGTVDVSVSNDGGTSPLDPAHDRFTYAAPPAVPTVSAVSPLSGLLSGGNTVMVTGTGFVSVTSILFGGTAADPSTIVVVDSAHLTVTAPPATVRGSVDVRVVNTTGESLVSAGDSYTYTSAPPALRIFAITLADGTVVTDLSGTIIVSATITFAWEATDDFDTILPDTWIEQSGGGRLKTGIPSFGNYAATYNTVLLADGFHLVDAAGTDSDGNEGFSPGVLLQVNNGLGTGSPNAPVNPDFTHPKSIAAIAQHVHSALAPATLAGPSLHPAVAQAVVAVTADLEERDKSLEDWLNRNTVRRVWVKNLLGTDHAHSDTGWIDVAPVTEVIVQKAQPRSVLVVTVGVAGQYNDDTPPHWVDLGVRVTGPAGYDRDLPVGRKTGRVNHESMQHAFTAVQAGDAPAGTYRVRLRVRTQRTDVAWLSTVNDTISLTVTEAPGT